MHFLLNNPVDEHGICSNFAKNLKRMVFIKWMLTFAIYIYVVQPICYSQSELYQGATRKANLKTPNACMHNQVLIKINKERPQLQICPP